MRRKSVRSAEVRPGHHVHRSDSPLSPETGRSDRRQIRQIVREVPGPSVAWQNAGWTLLAVAFSAGLALVALQQNVPVSATVLWAVSIASAIQACLCFLAHWDSNRGRKTRVIEIVEEAGDY